MNVLAIRILKLTRCVYHVLLDTRFCWSTCGRHKKEAATHEDKVFVLLNKDSLLQVKTSNLSSQPRRTDPELSRPPAIMVGQIMSTYLQYHSKEEWNSLSKFQRFVFEGHDEFYSRWGILSSSTCAGFLIERCHVLTSPVKDTANQRSIPRKEMVLEVCQECPTCQFFEMDKLLGLYSTCH